MSLFSTTPSFIPLKPSTNFISQTSHNYFTCKNRSQNPNKPSKISISSDAELASDFAAEVNKLNIQSKERENAMKRSKQLLFSDLRSYLNMNNEDVKNKWRSLSPDEKLGLVKEFICDWGLNFHPLSPKSVKDLVDEFVMKDLERESESSDLFQKNDGDDDVTASPAVILSTLKKVIMGFSSDN